MAIKALILKVSKIYKRKRMNQIEMSFSDCQMMK